MSAELLAAEIKELAPPERLRLAALMIEQAAREADLRRRLALLDSARSLAALVATELGAALMLARRP